MARASGRVAAHSSSLKLLHLSGLRGPGVYILSGKDYGRGDRGEVGWGSHQDVK